MKGVILAGGRGTRLQPLTYFCNKHLLPIYRVKEQEAVPIIHFPIQMFKEIGIEDIAVVLGDFRGEDILRYLEGGSRWGVNFTYFWQGQPLGIAHAISKAKTFLTEGIFFVCLGDNIFFNTRELNQAVGSFMASDCDAGVVFAKTDNPERFGVPYFNEFKLTEIKEKPSNPPNKLALTGFYYFKTKSFFNEYKKLKPSERGELELSDLISGMIGKYNVSYYVYSDLWLDAGTFENLNKIHDLR
jgi:glucose-1-phosphate thymidylyltransferase